MLYLYILFPNQTTIPERNATACDGSVRQPCKAITNHRTWLFVWLGWFALDDHSESPSSHLIANINETMLRTNAMIGITYDNVSNIIYLTSFL